MLYKLVSLSVGWDATGLKQEGDHFLSFWSGFGGLVIQRLELT